MAGTVGKLQAKMQQANVLNLAARFRERKPLAGSYRCCRDAKTSALKKIGRRTPRLRGLRRGVRRPLDSRRDIASGGKRGVAVLSMIWVRRVVCAIKY
jgi:hypothetical protein